MQHFRESMDQKQYKEVKRYIKEIVGRSPWKGQVYLVGGCVRDELLNQEVCDIDLFVNVPRGARRFTFWLDSHNLLQPIFHVFKRYETTKFCFREYPDLEIDVSCPHLAQEMLKGDTYTEQKAIQFLTHDCLMRDLSINSLYKNVMTGSISDMSGKGLSDLQNHILRTTSSPEIIYHENPACMIRTFRFSFKYGWEIEPETRQWLYSHIQLLKEARPSRIFREYAKVLESPHADAIKQIFQELGVLDFIEDIYKKEAVKDKYSKDVALTEQKRHTADEIQSIKDRRKEKIERRKHSQAADQERKRLKMQRDEERARKEEEIAKRREEKAGRKAALEKRLQKEQKKIEAMSPEKRSKYLRMKEIRREKRRKQKQRLARRKAAARNSNDE